METEQMIGIYIILAGLFMLNYFIVFSMLKDGDVFDSKARFWVCMIPFVIYIVLIISVVWGFFDYILNSNMTKQLKEKYNQLK